MRRPTAHLVALAVCALVAVAPGARPAVLASTPGPGAPDARDAADATGVAEAADALGVAGAAAIEALDDRGVTAQAASRARLTADELTDALAAEPAMFVTASTHVGVVEPLPLPDSTASPVLDPSDPGWSTPPADGTGGHVGSGDVASLPVGLPTLHSRPGASRVIVLDVDGHTTVGTPWNTSRPGVTTITSGPYDLDGDPASFSAPEQQRIVEIWASVAEDFAAFDVDVTTEDPGPAGIARRNSGDREYGTRVVITSTDWLAESGGQSVGGVAFVGSFGWSADVPAFVFAQHLGRDAKPVAEAAAHEAGHTFGLLHDGVAGGDAYYGGHGDWAPIMGVGYYRAITQWSSGAYPGASNPEPDAAVIAALTGDAPDDHAGSGSGATTIAPGTSLAGTIGRHGDVDVFAVDVGSGVLRAGVRPATSASDLHARVEIRLPDGTVLAGAQPSTAVGWRAEVAVAVTAGRYLVAVRGVGWGTAATGFPAEGSLGRYVLDVAAPGASGAGAGGGSADVEPVRLTPITPARLLDTRSGDGGSGRLGPTGSVRVQVAGVAGVPPGAAAAVLNVTAVAPGGEGYVTVWPCGPAGSNTSTVNYVAGEDTANTTIAALDPSGGVCLWTDAAVDLVVDVTGWLGRDGEHALAPIGPMRAVDTRIGLGGHGRLPAGGTIVVDLAGLVPAGSSAVAFNLTAVGADAPGYLTAYPCDAGLPPTSSVNFAAGEARPNNAVVSLSGSRLCVHASAATDVIIDVTGAFVRDGLEYVVTDPVRLLDTRTTGRVARDGVASFGAPPVRRGRAVAVSVNVTAVGPDGDGYTTAYGCGGVTPTSTVNQRGGRAMANGAITPLSGSGHACLYTATDVDLVVDLAGWWVQR